jgi:hypothetical protein
MAKTAGVDPEERTELRQDYASGKWSIEELAAIWKMSVEEIEKYCVPINMGTYKQRNGERPENLKTTHLRPRWYLKEIIYSKMAVFRLTTHAVASPTPTPARHVAGMPREARTSAGYMEVPHHKWWLMRANALRSPQTQWRARSWA